MYKSVGTYRIPARIKNNAILLSRWLKRLRFRPHLEKFFAKRFIRISRPIFEEQQKQANDLGIDTFGDIGCKRYRKKWRFAGNLSFTMRNFQTKPHADNDAKGFTYEMWIPIFTDDGRLAYWTDGYDVIDGDFFWPGFGISVNFGACDGVTEILWRGSRDRHGTEESFEPSGKFTHLGTSVQISKRLEDIMTGYKKSNFTNITTPLDLARRYVNDLKLKFQKKINKSL